MCLNLCDVGGPSVMFRVGFVWAGLCEKSHASLTHLDTQVTANALALSMMVKPCGGPMWGTGGTRCDRRESVGRGSSCWGDGP